MKIALFSDSFTQLDGVATHVQNIASLMANKGHDVTVYTGSGVSNEYKVVNLPRIPFAFSPGYEVMLPKSVHVDADVAHVHTVYSAGWVGMRKKMPHVATTHTMPKNMFPHGLAFLRPIGWKYLISFYNRADHVICQTERTAERFRRRGLKRPVSIASSGVDVDKFKSGSAERFRKKYGIEDEFVVNTARLSQEKRPEFALKACKELGLKVVFTSKGVLQGSLKRKYPGAIFLKMPREDLKDIYAAARVFVLPSAPEVECEGLGPLEAMCAGTPVVCSDVPHIVEDGENGFLVETYSYKEFKRKLEVLWRDEGLQRKFVELGRKTAEERDVKKSADKLIEVYKRLL